MAESPQWLPLYGALIATVSLALAVTSLGWQILSHNERPRIAVVGPQRLAGGAQYVPTMAERGSGINYRLVLVNQRSRPVSIVHGVVSGTLRNRAGFEVRVDNYEYTGFDLSRAGFPILLAPGEAKEVDLLLRLQIGKRAPISYADRFRGELSLALVTGRGTVSPGVAVELRAELVGAAVGVPVIE